MSETPRSFTIGFIILVMALTGSCRNDAVKHQERPVTFSNSDRAMHQRKYQTAKTRIPIDADEKLSVQEADVVAGYSVICMYFPGHPELQRNGIRVNGERQFMQKKYALTKDEATGLDVAMFPSSRIGYFYKDGSVDLIGVSEAVGTDVYDAENKLLSSTPGAKGEIEVFYRLYDNGRLRNIGLGEGNFGGIDLAAGRDTIREFFPVLWITAIEKLEAESGKAKVEITKRLSPDGRLEYLKADDGGNRIEVTVQGWTGDSIPMPKQAEFTEWRPTAGHPYQMTVFTLDDKLTEEAKNPR